MYGDDGRNVLNHAMAEMTPSAWGFCELVQLGGGIEAAASAEVRTKGRSHLSEQCEQFIDLFLT